MKKSRHLFNQLWLGWCLTPLWFHWKNMLFFRGDVESWGEEVNQMAKWQSWYVTVVSFMAVMVMHPELSQHQSALVIGSAFRRLNEENMSSSKLTRWCPPQEQFGAYRSPLPPLATFARWRFPKLGVPWNLSILGYLHLWSTYKVVPHSKKMCIDHHYPMATSPYLPEIYRNPS